MSSGGPIAAALRGALAGAAGTAAMDLFWQARGGLGGPVKGAEERAAPAPAPASRFSPRLPSAEEDGEAWDAAEDAEEWMLAPAPARVGKQFYEGVTQRTLEARFARVAGALVHWAYGMWWGGLFGLVAGSGRRSRTGWGPLFGAAVWATSYLLLPVTGLYRPVWEYRPEELAPDLAAHLIYGTGTAAALDLIDRRFRG
jgi:hypothetical protein